MNSIVLGIDIGGSHITAALIDLESRKMIRESMCRGSINSSGTLDEILDGWTKVMQSCIKFLKGDEVFIAIAMPGPFDYEKGISYIKNQHKYAALYEKCVKDLIANRLDIDPDNIRFLNDAACFLRGEAFGGIARNYDSALGITLGTGFGSAFLKDGNVEDANLWCSPFWDGISEDYFSTRWFLKRYQEKTARVAGNVKEIADLYHKSEDVKAIFDEFGSNLASFFLTRFHPDEYEVIVIGGNISNSFDYFYPALEAKLRSAKSPMQVKRSVLNENASLVGSASCWLSETV